ncbi:pimeloyl-ACP methyl ester carboxylesterase [Microbacterium trichothecenolyticum]|uniref:Pimeloyl-ACP methyl ester carboxylesterase n=1 Tax=Microbacterium trichothecenolyticum TaxID=69370 RepID=A0ABU0TTB3_MICTR|nr:pimeloyl-ACP methyl ester carboxylesterase [Microbacterium trichothecenolyticum]
MSSGSNRHPVVLLHGWPVTEGHWRHLTPRLEQAGFDVVPVTLPGLGAAPEEDQSLRKADLAHWLRSFLDRRGITRFALIGHDWGATVAVLLAGELGSRVTALVIEEEILPGIDIDIPAAGRDHYPEWHGPFNRAVGLAERLVPGREAVYYGLFLQQSAGPAGLDDDVTRSYVNAYSAPGVSEAGFGYYRTRSDDVNYVRRLLTRRITPPVLAIGGRFAMGSAVGDGMRAVAEDVTSVVLDDSGHYPLEQEPEEAGRAVIQFLRKRHDRTSTVVARGQT